MHRKTEIDQGSREKDCGSHESTSVLSVSALPTMACWDASQQETDVPLIAKPIRNPNFDELRAKVMARFAKTLAYLAR